MVATLAASIIDLAFGLRLGPTEGHASNRVTLEGVTLGSGLDGSPELRIAGVELASLRLASAAFTLDAAKPLALPAGSWSLAPLATAEGMVRAKIIDAHLSFDADVTVPIRQGQIDFDDATVEHVGPDSRMGVSRMGLYVDAPNGRSYLYQFPATPVAGVEFEQRGALLGPWVSDRGKLQLQPFVEGLLGQGTIGHGAGLTEQTRLLLHRTSVSGDVQLADGNFAAPGMQAELVGRANGRNAVRVQSPAVGRGLTLEMGSLSLHSVVLDAGGRRLVCGGITGAIQLQLLVEGKQVRLVLDVASLELSNLHVPLRAPARGARDVPR